MRSELKIKHEPASDKVSGETLGFFDLGNSIDERTNDRIGSEAGMEEIRQKFPFGHQIPAQSAFQLNNVIRGTININECSGAALDPKLHNQQEISLELRFGELLLADFACEFIHGVDRDFECVFLRHFSSPFLIFYSPDAACWMVTGDDFSTAASGYFAEWFRCRFSTTS
jgi:hypothetical protein